MTKLGLATAMFAHLRPNLVVDDTDCTSSTVAGAQRIESFNGVIEDRDSLASRDGSLDDQPIQQCRHNGGARLTYLVRGRSLHDKSPPILSSYYRSRL